MKIIEGICMFLLGFILGCILICYVFKNEHNRGYKYGYKDAKLIYECDHDRAECEIIKDTL